MCIISRNLIVCNLNLGKFFYGGDRGKLGGALGEARNQP